MTIKIVSNNNNNINIFTLKFQSFGSNLASFFNTHEFVQLKNSYLFICDLIFFLFQILFAT